jgi:hypothetical protein
MSRGPGPLQRRVLEVLAQYEALGKSLGWEWNHRPHLAVTDSSIQAYERGHYVPVWMLLRDLGCRKDDLSRALKGLERQNLAYRLNDELDAVGKRSNCKFATIMDDGVAWLKRQQKQSAEVGA